MVGEHRYPWENIKKFKLPFHKRLLLIFLSKKDCIEIKTKIEQINKIRIEDAKRRFKESRPEIRQPKRKEV